MPGELCAICKSLRDQDALQLKTFEIVETSHNACAPVTYYTCECKTCRTRWHATEVYDELEKRPSAWSWAIDRSGSDSRDK